MANKIGVHLANDGNINWSDVEGLTLVKGLVRLDLDYEPTNYRELANHLRSDCDVVLRLFWPGYLEPMEFVKRARGALPPILDALRFHRIFIEIHNEPNHRDGIEGWGKTVQRAEEFRAWYWVVLNALQPHYVNLGFPGLAVGEWAHGERTWAEICRDCILASDWVGIHCYWQTPEQLEDERLGRNWLWYKETFPDKTLLVTEAGNSSCDNSALPQITPARQADEYTQFAHDAAVHGVAFFLAGGTEDWTGFRIFPETLDSLRRTIGGSSS